MGKKIVIGNDVLKKPVDTLCVQNKLCVQNVQVHAFTFKSSVV